MSDGIRKPWLLDYLVKYAEQHGGELSTVLQKRGKVQIINFRTLPESTEEWVWADVSDKRHAITVRFTMEAVKSFNKDPANAGRRIISRRWAVATIRCIHPLWCRPPADNGRGLEEKWTLALVVDQIDVAASEGEAMFGEPKCVTKEEPMWRWIEGLRAPHGAGGSVLKRERIEREKQERELLLAAKQTNHESPRPSTNSVFKPEPRSSKPTLQPKRPSAHHRARQWKTKMKELGLVLAQEYHKIPDDQQQNLNEITKFGLEFDLVQLSLAQTQEPTGKSTAEPDLHSEPTQQRPVSPPNSRHGISDGPTTPSHWSASQRTNLDQEPEGDQDEAVVSETELQDVDIQTVENTDDLQQEFQEQEEIVVIEQHVGDPSEDEAEDAEFEVARTISENVIGVDKPFEEQDEEVGHITEHIVLPMQHSQGKNWHQHLRPLGSLHKPVVLVPDSDMSGSQSQSQSQSRSLTQPSTSQPSVTSRQNARSLVPIGSSPHNAIPESSYPQSGPVLTKPQTPFVSHTTHGKGKENHQDEDDELESDDEAAQKILASVGTYLDRPICRFEGSAPQSLLLTPTLVCPDITALPLHDRVNQEAALPDRSENISNGPLLTAATGLRSDYVSNMRPVSPTATSTSSRRRKRSFGEATTPGENLEQTRRASKRHKTLSGEVVVKRVEHDVQAWKDPSFVRSSTKSTGRAKREEREPDHEAQYIPGSDALDPTSVDRQKHARRGQRSPPPSYVKVEPSRSKRSLTNDLDTEQASSSMSPRERSGVRRRQDHTSRVSPTPHVPFAAPPPAQRSGSTSNPKQTRRPFGLGKLPKEVSPNQSRLPAAETTNSVKNLLAETRAQKPLKLGGWRPQKDVKKGPRMMTWEDFNKVLLTVGCIREQAAKFKDKSK